MRPRRLCRQTRGALTIPTEYPDDPFLARGSELLGLNQKRQVLKSEMKFKCTSVWALEPLTAPRGLFGSPALRCAPLSPGRSGSALGVHLDTIPLATAPPGGHLLHICRKMAGGQKKKRNKGKRKKSWGGSSYELQRRAPERGARGWRGRAAGNWWLVRDVPGRQRAGTGGGGDAGVGLGQGQRQGKT